MADTDNLRPAIDILMCHTGVSFNEACAELGFSPEEIYSDSEANNEE